LKISSLIFSAHAVFALICLLFFAVPGASSLHAQIAPRGWERSLPVSILTDDTRFLEPGKTQEVFEDPGKNLTIHDVRLAKFQHVNSRFASAGISASAWWIRFRFENRSDMEDWLLQESFPLIEDLQVFVVSDDRVVNSWVTGIRFPYSQRFLDHRTFLFRTGFEKNKTYTIYARFVTQPSLNMPLILWRPEAFASFASKEDILMGIFFGILLVMSVYNLFLFFSVKDISYLYYTLYCISGGLFMASQLGYAYQYLWPDSTWLALRANAILNGLFLLFTTVFCTRFLGFRKNSPILFRIAAVIFFSAIAITVGSIFLPYQSIAEVRIFMTIPASVLFLFGGGMLAIRGQRHAVLFVIAYSVFFIGALVYSLRTLAFLNFSYLATYSLQVGSAIELVIMSIALADRINLLRLEREKAEFSNRMKSEFLAIMSHEIRTPMSGVIGLTSILGKTELKEDQREILHLIQRSGGALMKIINDILDLSRLDADKVLLDESVFDLREIFTDTMDLLKPAAQEKDLGFLLELDASLPAKVKGDPARLRQVLLNLIGNALKFTETGSILIAVKRIYGRDLRILVSISDTGIGIAPEKLEYLFEPFSQVDVSISRNYGGTGLGLAISKKLVNTMGGTIGVESRPGAGSRFFLELPFMEAFESKAASAAPDTEVADGDVLREEIDRDGSEIPLSQKYPQKILVAEDDYVNSMIIQKFLEELGYSTDSVTNGLQALEKAKSNKYTIVFMDVQMPLLDGLEATKILKETLGEQCPVIIATTANATEEDLRRCLASGMDGTLVKPFSIDSLRRILVKSGEG